MIRLTYYLFSGFSVQQPYAATSVTYQEKPRASNVIDSCGPCDLYQRHMRDTEKRAKDAGLEGSVKHPIYMTPQGRIMADTYCE